MISFHKLRFLLEIFFSWVFIICEEFNSAYNRIGDEYMKRISIQDYQKEMGPLIDLSSPEGYDSFHFLNAINIPYQKFMLYYDQYLDKHKSYFLTCKKGIHSNQAVRILEYLGYDVTQVI